MSGDQPRTPDPEQPEAPEPESGSLRAPVAGDQTDAISAEDSLARAVERAYAPSRGGRFVGAIWTIILLAVVAVAGAYFHKPVVDFFRSTAAAGTETGDEAKAKGDGEDAEGTSAEEPGAEAEEKTKYTCGMHPQIVLDEPGFCPVCGMKLTPIKKKKKRKKKVTGEAACKGRKILYWQAPMNPKFKAKGPGKSPMGMDLIQVCESDEEEPEGGISVDARIRQNMGILTKEVTRGKLVKEIRTVGHVDYDERLLAIINTKLDGWVERLHVDFTGEYVKKGQPLLSLYSPLLISTQEELLLAVRQFDRSRAKRDKILVEAAERRLRYWDISWGQIRRIERSGKVRRTLTIYAPMAGVVTHKDVFEGKHVKAGMDLFRIADLSRVWVYAHIYEMDVPYVRDGDDVELLLPYQPGVRLRGKVDYIFPWLDKKTRDVKARLVFNNPDGQLKPDMYASLVLQRTLDEDVVLVDDSAVIRSGVRNVVFVEKEAGLYDPRMIEIGREGVGVIEVLKGLDPGEKVVIRGQFMLDSESRLKEVLTKYEEVPKEGAEGGKTGGDDDKTAKLDALEKKGCTHTCPMSMHWDVCGKKAEPCPKCGMTMEPIEELRKKLQEKKGAKGHEHMDHGKGMAKMAGKKGAPKDAAAALDALEKKGCTHTCPMEDHLDVCGKGPGECPKCGMSLRTLDAVRKRLVGKHGGKAKLPPLEALDLLEAQGCTHTCPMSMHFDVCGMKAEPCPKCGMTMRPIDELRERHAPGKGR